MAIFDKFESCCCVLRQVVHTDVVLTVDGFKNGRSLLGPERYFFNYTKGEKAYVVLAGEIGSMKFPPTAIGLNRIEGARLPEFAYPAVPFLLFNAYPALSNITVYLPTEARSLKRIAVRVPYGQAMLINVTAKRGNTYVIRVRGGEYISSFPVKFQCAGLRHCVSKLKSTDSFKYAVDGLQVTDSLAVNC